MATSIQQLLDYFDRLPNTEKWEEAYAPYGKI